MTTTRKQLLATIEQMPDFSESYGYTGKKIRDWCIGFIEDYIDYNDEGKELETDTITDMVFEYAEQWADIYNGDLLEWFAKDTNYEYLDELHNELGHDVNGDIMGGIRAAQAWTIQRAITEALESIIEVATEEVE